jgi:chorismate synthase
MPSNSFGQLFKITTFGESHGPMIGVVIDGCPAGVLISIEEINLELKYRRPGSSSFVSPRKEEDLAEICSGVFDGKTTGAPICIILKNKDVKSESYIPIKDLYRPGHANFTYLHKYGIFDFRGGGRASARETAARVAAGAIAKKILRMHGVDCVAFLSGIQEISLDINQTDNLSAFREKVYNSPLFCPDEVITKKMENRIHQIQEMGDSVGGIISCIAKIPKGLGEPIYLKLEALLGFAMLSIPACKGFEIGDGFLAASKLGSEHNDLFCLDGFSNPSLSTNHAGGVLGGISSGEDLFFRVAFKPTSSIKKSQSTVSTEGEIKELKFPEGSRHDPCVAIRAAPIVEAMASIVLVDAIMLNMHAKF